LTIQRQMTPMDGRRQDPAAATASQVSPEVDGGPAPPRGAPRTAPPLTRLDRPALPAARPGIEEGGPAGPEPTRFGDWERKGRVSDF
jgi:hypothetical protein